MQRHRTAQPTHVERTGALSISLRRRRALSGERTSLAERRKEQALPRTVPAEQRVKLHPETDSRSAHTAPPRWATQGKGPRESENQLAIPQQLTQEGSCIQEAVARVGARLQRGGGVEG